MTATRAISIGFMVCALAFLLGGIASDLGLTNTGNALNGIGSFLLVMGLFGLAGLASDDDDKKKVKDRADTKDSIAGE